MKYFKLFCMTLLLISCSKQTIDQQDFLPEGNLLRAKVNGKVFLATDNIVAGGFSQVDSLTVILVTGGFAVKSSNDISSEALAIGLTIVRDEEFMATSEWYTTDEDRQIIVTGAYSKLGSLSSDSDLLEASSENEGGSARIRITDLDKEGKTISGEFEFTAVSEETKEVFLISEGSFTKAPYK